MTATEITSLGGVAARNAIPPITDVTLLYAIRREETAGKNRGIVLDTVARRLRILGADGEDAIHAPAEPIAEIVAVAPEVVPEVVTPDATCTRCHAVHATGEEQIGAVFGWRTPKGGKRIRQPQCKKCRALPPLVARAPKVPAGVDPKCPDCGCLPGTAVHDCASAGCWCHS